MAMKLSVIFDGQNAQLKKAAAESSDSLSQLKTVASQAAKSVGAAFAAYASVTELIEVTKKYQRLEAQLLTATGSIQNQTAAFAALKDFAYQTGQDIEAVTQGFTKLVNLGLNPSREALEAYANVAAGTGKTTVDFIEAVADAATAEFERLKEFGIKAKNEGDTVQFTFRGVTTTVKNSATDIENYLIKLGQVQFAGAVENQAKTLEAQINRLGMSWDDFVYQISKSGAGEVIATTVGIAADALRELTAMMASGELSAYLTAWADQFSGTADVISGTISQLGKNYETEIGGIGAKSDAVGDIILDAIKFFPTYVTAMIKILAVELANMVELGKAYGAAFGEVIVNELSALVDKAGIYAKELAESLNPFVDESFDHVKALSEIEAQAAANNARYFEQAKVQASQASTARQQVIDQILAEVEATKAATQTKIDEAKRLREAYDADAKMKAGTNLGQFSKGGESSNGGGKGGSSGSKSDEFQKLVDSLKSEEEKIKESYNRRKALILENTKASSEEQKKLLDALQKDYDTKRLAELTKVEESLKTEEQKILESYNRRRQIILDNTAATSQARADLLKQLDQQYGEQVLKGFGDRPEQQSIETQIAEINAEFEIRRQAILANTQLTEDQRTALETELSKRRAAMIATLENQRANMILSSSQMLFSGLADLAKTFGGEQSRAYKAMFAITKGFAVAQGVLNLATAISNASALPWPANFAAMAQAAVQGAQLVSNIKGASYQGQAHDGIGYVPQANEGTWLLKKGEMVLNNKQRDNFETLVDYANGGQRGTNAGGTIININNKIDINAQGAAPGTEQAISEALDAATQRMKQEIAEDFSNGGPLAQRLSGRGIAA